MAAVADHKTVYPGFSGDLEVVKVVWDFAVDGGATGALDLITADGDVLIMNYCAKVITAVTSSSGLSIDVGVVGGDTDVLMDGVAKASLTQNSVHSAPIVLTEGTPNVGTLPLPIRLADGGKIAQTIITTAADAGKIEYTFVIARA